MDISSVTNPEAKRFITTFLANREINTEFYRRVPEEQFDFRMVNTASRKSDSPRESLLHQIDTTKDYIQGIISGVLQFELTYDDLSPSLSKQELIQKLDQTEKELVNVLSSSDIREKLMTVPWSTSPIPALSAIWGLNSHEILHTGWNLAIMDQLNIDRFPALRKMWG
jgi:hypothetical protein